MQTLSVGVIDDSPDIRDILKQRLSSHGYDVRVFENGDAAVPALEQQPVDVIITDLKMPGTIDGIRLLDIVKQNHPATEVIIITGFATVETAIEALRKGAVDYLIKPFNFEELLLWLKRIARKREILATLQHAEYNKEQGFSDLHAIINSLVATCSKIEKILSNQHEPEAARIEKALRLLSQRTA
ncbi:MAG: response regulator [Desulfobacterota bacterium]|nr:response regulator [Thermodesulfobacteriota bacterium]